MKTENLDSYVINAWQTSLICIAVDDNDLVIFEKKDTNTINNWKIDTLLTKNKMPDDALSEFLYQFFLICEAKAGS